MLIFIYYYNNMVSDVKLVNAGFYDDLEAKMQRYTQQDGVPTVRAYIAEMRKKGNIDFYNNRPDVMSRSAIEVPLRSDGSILHEILHPALRLGHSPLEEMFLINAMLGLTHHEGRFQLEEYADYNDFYQDKIAKNADLVSGYTQKGTEDKWAHVSQKDASVYFAAGLYLKQKLADYHQQFTHEPDYLMATRFCAHYANPKNDAPPSATLARELKSKIIGDAPYTLITLSRNEIREIMAVATGVKQPEKSDYPHRMAPIKAELEKTGLFYNLANKLNINQSSPESTLSR